MVSCVWMMSSFIRRPAVWRRLEARESPPETNVLLDPGGQTTPEIDFFRCSGGCFPPDFLKSRLLGGLLKGCDGCFELDFCYFDKQTCQNWATGTMSAPPEYLFPLDFGGAAPPGRLFFFCFGGVWSL